MKQKVMNILREVLGDSAIPEADSEEILKKVRERL